MSRLESMSRIAHRAALRDSDEACTFLLGAVVARGNRILATGACTSKTHPKNPKLKAKTKRSQVCAEVQACLRALRKVQGENLDGCTVYVVRGTKTGEHLLMAKPCHHCQRFMAELGIRHVFYSDRDGILTQMYLN